MAHLITGDHQNHDGGLTVDLDQQLTNLIEFQEDRLKSWNDSNEFAKLDLVLELLLKDDDYSRALKYLRTVQKLILKTINKLEENLWLSNKRKPAVQRAMNKTAVLIGLMEDGKRARTQRDDSLVSMKGVIDRQLRQLNKQEATIGSLQNELTEAAMREQALQAQLQEALKAAGAGERGGGASGSRPRRLSPPAEASSEASSAASKRVEAENLRLRKEVDELRLAAAHARDEADKWRSKYNELRKGLNDAKEQEHKAAIAAQVKQQLEAETKEREAKQQRPPAVRPRGDASWSFSSTSSLPSLSGPSATSALVPDRSLMYKLTMSADGKPQLVPGLQTASSLRASSGDDEGPGGWPVRADASTTSGSTTTPGGRGAFSRSNSAVTPGRTPKSFRTISLVLSMLGPHLLEGGVDPEQEEREQERDRVAQAQALAARTPRFLVEGEKKQVVEDGLKFCGMRTDFLA